MGVLITLTLLFLIAAVAIVVYFKCTPKGRMADVGSNLEEATLQGKLLDSVEETRRVNNELHKRLENLKTPR
jgi:hypothetical protein